MPHELFIALIAGLAGMLGWGLADFFAKKTIDRIGDVQTLAWAGLFGTLAYFVAALVQNSRGAGLTVPHDIQTWLLLAFFGALQAAVYLFAYRGFGKGQVALLSPVFATFSGIVALVSLLFLGEATTALRLIALVVIFAGIMLLSLDLSAFKNRSVAFIKVAGFREVVIATILAALWTLLWSTFVEGHDSLAYSFYMFLFMTATVFIFALHQRLPMRVNSRAVWLFVALIGICEVIAYIGITLGYGATNMTSIVALLSGGSPLATVVLAYLFLKERMSPIQWVGVAVIIGGIMLLPLV